MKKYFHPFLYKISPYVPGEQPSSKNIIKLNTNENPYPPSPKIIKAGEEILKQGLLRKYPNPVSSGLAEEISNLYSIQKEEILVTNGSDEALSLFFKAVTRDEDFIIIPYPTYSLYPVLTEIQMRGSKLKKIPLKKDYHIDFKKLNKMKGRALLFASPNAPTGILEDKNEILDLVKNFDGPVLCDEAYIDFAPENSSVISEIKNFPNLFVTRTFSKSYSLAGARVGFIASQAQNINEIFKLKDSYNVNMLSQAIAIEALKDKNYFKQNIIKILKTRKFLVNELEKLGFTTLSSSANFIFTKPPLHFPAENIFNLLKEKNIFLRYFKTPECKDFLRITIGTDSEIEILISEIKKIIIK